VLLLPLLLLAGFVTLWVLRVPQLSFLMTVGLCLVAASSLAATIYLLQYWAEQRISALKLRPVDCQSCADGEMRLVCNKCGAFNWLALRGCSGALTPFAGWVSKHGGPAIAGVMSIVAAVAGSFCYQAFLRDQAKHQALLETAKSALDAGNRYRGALLQLESTCDSPRAEACYDRLTEFRENYLRYAREAPELVWEFSTSHCRGGGVTDIDRKERTRGLCEIVERFPETPQSAGPIDDLNGTFRAYLNVLASCRKGDRACVATRRWVAQALYENGRKVQCMLYEVMYGIQYFDAKKPFGTHAKCDNGAGWQSVEASDYMDPLTRELQWLHWPSDEP
jgi:hypothetical protein